MINKTLFFGATPPPYTGQSISFTQAYNNFKGEKILFCTTKFESYKLINSIYSFICLPIIFLFYRFDNIYFTCTRSNFGFIKDFQLLLLARIFKKKVVNHLHGADFLHFYENSGFLKKIIKWSYNKINTNIVLLPSMVEQFKDFPDSNIKVISNCYSPDYSSFKMDFSKKKTQIIFLSNLLYSKGIFLFLKAISKLLKIHDDLVVKIAGLPMADEYMSVKEVRTKFAKESQKIKIIYPNRFHYLGLVQGENKQNLLEESSIFVLPTFYKTEALPLTIIEAMFYGNAVITTKHNYLGDIISIKNGCLVKPKSHEDIVKSVSLLLNDKCNLSKIQLFNHNEAIKRYNPKEYYNNINRVIDNLF